MIRTLLLALALACAPLSAVAQSDPWFSIDVLNEGLSEPPATVDRRTPRAAVATLLRAEESGDWDAAAHVLDLSDVPAAQQAVEGPILARQLASVIDRKAVLDWEALNARPDGLSEIGGRAEAQAGDPRRSFLLRDLDLDPVPVPIRLERVRAGEDADPQWVFSRETVADLPALYARYGPSEFEGKLPGWLRAEAFWGLMWWEILGLPLLVAASVGLGLLIHRTLGKARAHGPGGLAGRVMRAVSAPVIIAAVTGLVWWMTSNVFVFSGRIDTLLAPLIAIGFVTAILMLIVNVVEVALDALVAPGDDVDLTAAERDEQRSLATKLNAGKRILTIVVFLIGAGVVMSTADVFRGLGLSLLASAGALTIVLGFAARRVLGNIMASLQIAMNQSARVGDRVMYKGELCHVERIHMTYVQLKDWDGTRVVVPVEEFVSEHFSNWSLQEPAMLRLITFKLDPKADLEALREANEAVLDELYAGDLAEEMGERDEGGVKITGQDVFGIDVLFMCPCADPNTSWEVACTMREKLVARMNDIETEERPIWPEAAAAEAA